MENLEILEETENPLFKRKEIRLNIRTDSSPRNAEVKESIAQKFSVPKENIKIKKIDGKFGSKNFVVNANVYESEEAKNAIEPDKKSSNEGDAEQSTETTPETPAETPKENVETPTEEKPTEEPKQEESIENKVEEKENAKESN